VLLLVTSERVWLGRRWTLIKTLIKTREAQEIYCIYLCFFSTSLLHFPICCFLLYSVSFHFLFVRVEINSRSGAAMQQTHELTRELFVSLMYE
jgi:hypothetical protein